MPKLIITGAKINEYPGFDENNNVTTHSHFTLGDLHGNALKFLFFLIRHGIFSLHPDARIAANIYKNLVNIYNKEPEELTKQDLENFCNYISLSTVNTDVTITLLGDELADRGKNDYFILKIIEKLGNENAKFNIGLSNHGAEFLVLHESTNGLKPSTKNKRFYNIGMKDNYVCSMQNLGLLIKKDLVSKQEIDEIINVHYKPHLKLVMYSIDSSTVIPTITIKGHAPFGLETIKALANLFGVAYTDKTIEDLAGTIDIINIEFQKKYVKRGKIHKLLRQDDNHPVTKLIWQRIHGDYSILNLLPNNDSYKLTLIHGHDGGGLVPFAYQDKVTNLDDYFGKYSADKVNDYIVDFNQGSSKQMYSLLCVSKDSYEYSAINSQENTSIIAEIAKIAAFITANLNQQEIARIFNFFDFLVVGRNSQPGTAEFNFARDIEKTRIFELLTNIINFIEVVDLNVDPNQSLDEDDSVEMIKSLLAQIDDKQLHDLLALRELLCKAFKKMDYEIFCLMRAIENMQDERQAIIDTKNYDISTDSSNDSQITNSFCNKEKNNLLTSLSIFKEIEASCSVFQELPFSKVMKLSKNY